MAFSPGWGSPSSGQCQVIPGQRVSCRVWSLGLQWPPPTNLTSPRRLRAGQRSLGGSAPVAIPGCLPRSPSLHSSSSLSASPLSSFSQPLPGPLISSAMTPPQQPPPLKSEPRALGPAASSYNSFGEWPCGAPGWGEPQCCPSCPVATAQPHGPERGPRVRTWTSGGVSVPGTPHCSRTPQWWDPPRRTCQAHKSAEAKHRSRWIGRNRRLVTCFKKKQCFYFLKKETMFLNTCFTL